MKTQQDQGASSHWDVRARNLAEKTGNREWRSDGGKEQAIRGRLLSADGGFGSSQEV